MFQAKAEAGHYEWQLGRVDLEPVAGVITMCPTMDEKPAISVPVSEITHCEVVERKDSPYLTRGWNPLAELRLGCFLFAAFMPWLSV